MKITAHTMFEGVMKLTYNGVPCLKCPTDYILYQKLLFDIKPDLIIEIGTNKGGSALYLADILDVIGKGIIHTIDIHDDVNEKLKRHKRIKFFLGGYQGYKIENANKYKKILIIDDASHFYEDVIGALNKFSNLITKNSYFIIEDGIIDELGMTKDYNGSPVKAIEEFLTTNKDFIIDEDLCNFFGQNSTFNTKGYLKKIN